MPKIVNRAYMTTATTGTGTITLGSAVASFRSFAASGVVDGDVVRYVIEDGDNWEIGSGTYAASGTTLTRAVEDSSTGGTAINLSGTAVVFVTAVAADFAPIRQPVITSPTADETGVAVKPTIVGSAYAALYSADARAHRLFEIDLASGDFSAPVVSAQVNADSYTATSNLASNTSHKARIKDVSAAGAESGFSDVVAFQTAAIIVSAPTLTVEGSPSSVPESPTLTTGAFATTPTGEDTHASTNWIVRLSADDTIVYQSPADTVNLLSIVVPSGILLANTTYKFQVQHIGATLGASAVTEVTATTLVQFEIVPLLTVCGGASPFITIYNQEIDTFTKLDDPSVLPPAMARGVAFSNDDTYMAVGSSPSPVLTIYKRSIGVFTKLADPSELPPNSRGHGVAFTSDATYLAIAHNLTPFITIYKRSGDTFTKLANPATLPASNGLGVAFSSDDTYMAVSHSTSPFITIYKRSGDTFTKLANPAILPTGTGLGVAFSSDDTYMAVSHQVSPFITIYKRSGDTFNRLGNPATLPTGTCNNLAFSADNTYLALGSDVAPFIIIYKRNGDTFTKLADPAILPPAGVYGVDFSADNIYLAMAHDLSPFVTIYKRAGDTFTKLADPAILPTAVSYGPGTVAFSNTGFPQ